MTVLNASKNKDSYFDIEIRNKKYPSCYQYNVLIMLAITWCILSTIAFAWGFLTVIGFLLMP